MEITTDTIYKYYLNPLYRSLTAEVTCMISTISNLYGNMWNAKYCFWCIINFQRVGTSVGKCPWPCCHSSILKVTHKLIKDRGITRPSEDLTSHGFDPECPVLLTPADNGVGDRWQRRGRADGRGKLGCSLALKADLMYCTTLSYYSTPAPPKQVCAACLPAIPELS